VPVFQHTFFPFPWYSGLTARHSFGIDFGFFACGNSLFLGALFFLLPSSRRMSSLARIREQVLRLGAAGWPGCFWEGRLGGTTELPPLAVILWPRFGFTSTSTVARRPPLVRPVGSEGLRRVVSSYLRRASCGIKIDLALKKCRAVRCSGGWSGWGRTPQQGSTSSADVKPPPRCSPLRA
jgi:hypothetical protein